MTKYEVLRKFAKTDRQLDYIDALEIAGSNAAAARDLGIDRRTVDRAIKAMEEEAHQAGFQILAKVPRILFIDIETTPIVGYMWSLFQQGFIGGHKHIVEDTMILCYAYKWQGDEGVTFVRPAPADDGWFYYNLWELFNEADWVVAHNGDKFDIKLINTWLLLHHLPPYRPIKSIDTLKMAKRKFRFTSNRLDALGATLFGERKADTGGFELWLDCMRGDVDAWAKMEAYNVQDVLLLEKVYKALASWDHLHPNYNVFSEDSELALRCTTCGSDKLTPNGTVKTATMTYPVYRCGDCGAQSRGRRNLRSPDAMQAVLAHAI